MAPGRLGSSLVAACGLGAGRTIAGVSFVPAAAPRSSSSQPLAERAAAATPAAAGTASGGAAAAAAGFGVAAVAAATSRRAAATRAKASTAAAPEVAEKSAPPTPPPFDPAKQPGVTLPLNYFDPVGFSKVGDKEGFRNFRCAELKHGRVAMMAALGAVLQHFIKLPGFEQVPSGIEAVITPPGTYGLVVLVGLAGAVETLVWTQDPEKEPGDFGDPLGVGQYYEEWRNRELNNGRFAMIAILAILFTELATGKDGVDQVWSSTAGNLPVE
eukprot:CAMPEP_0175507164 /NCGR_PEP_ID=MMETSP0096-20121207/9719_1 /TAXON_ID=311494 /ORGANISM="Alexandrium monilatum, Strain CCMP3105" /LENGTH=270 /DNA_ID=CAMNT_0016809275 /DNA_START=75 /DNA_END=887 /DNA_ORIENTATION=+